MNGITSKIYIHYKNAHCVLRFYLFIYLLKKVDWTEHKNTLVANQQYGLVMGEERELCTRQPLAEQL